MAHWITEFAGFGGTHWTCSECGYCFSDLFHNIISMSDCPKCGAVMTEESKEGCDLCVNGACTKWHRQPQCEPSTIDWFTHEPLDFIPVNKVCRKGSVFGNEYIGLNQGDVDRLKNGEIIHISGEYGTFIGFTTDPEESISAPISPETFASRMREIYNQYEDDPECCHSRMDDLMCKLLTELGYGEGVKIFEDTGKWYA